MDKSFYKSLHFQVLVAIVMGVVIGYFQPQWGVSLEPLGTGFVKLIKMIIAPVIFCTIVTGIAGMENLKSVGKTGGFALLYFEVVSTIALLVGLIVINVVQPGVGMNADPSLLDPKSVAKYTTDSHHQTAVEFALNIIPKTFVGAFAEGEILPVLLISLLVGFSLHSAGERGKPIFDFIDQFTHVLFGIVGIIMYVAPLATLGAMAFTVGSFGAKSLLYLGWLMACFYLSCLFFIFGVLGLIAKVHGFSIFRFVKYIGSELLIVLGTSSSETVLPRLMKKMEAAGCRKSAVQLVIPTGYSFNLDGTSLYLTMAAVFIAQATNTHLPLSEQLGLLIVLLLTSKGAAAVTGGGFIVLAATLSTTGTIPVVGLALIFGIDRFMSQARALTNLVGNGVATVVVAKWCKQIDEKKIREHLA